MKVVCVVQVSVTKNKARFVNLSLRQTVDKKEPNTIVSSHRFQLFYEICQLIYFLNNPISVALTISEIEMVIIKLTSGWCRLVYRMLDLRKFQWLEFLFAKSIIFSNLVTSYV